MKTISTIIFALLVTSSAQAQQRWTRTYGGAYIDGANSVQQTSDGGCIIAGYTNSFGAGGSDVYLVKTNASGDTIWTRTYGGAGDDVCYSVQQTADRGYIVVGVTLSFSASRDVYLIKTDSSGDTIWTKKYGGAGNDIGYSVEQTADGGYIVAGYTYSFGAGGADVYLIKTNASGDTLWTKTYGGAGDDEGYSVRQTSDGGYIIAGSSTSFGPGFVDVCLVKTNASGDTLWTRTYGGTLAAYGYSVRQTSDGGYIIAGDDESFRPDTFEVYLVKTNASGDTLWSRSYGGERIAYGNSVGQTSDGGYVVTGYTTLSPLYDNNLYLIKTNASGDTLWTKVYGGGADDEGKSVQQTSDGGYIVAGLTNSFGAGSYDAYVIKTDANGSAGVEEQESSGRETLGSMKVSPNPFVSFARIPRHEAERFHLYDVSGKMVGAYRGDRIGEGLSPAVYFIKSNSKQDGSLRIVKIR